jgi:PDDEXK-like uncharacterized protein DUF3799
MKIDKPGLYKGMLAEDYFADPCPEPSFSQSIGKILIDQSPLHAKQAHPRLAQPIDGDDEEAEKYDKAKAIGNACHLIMMGRGKRLSIIDAPNFKAKAAQTDKQAAILAGDEPILRKHYNIAHAMSLAARLQFISIPGCDQAFKLGDGEVVIANVEDGIWLRSMIDWITPDLREVWDLKTSGMSASPYATGKLMASAGWHLQAAMHERILDALDPVGAGRRRFFYVCQENEAPFALTVNEIGEAALTIGRKQIDYAIKMWAHCLTKNVWPAYPSRIIRPELPAWAENSWLARELAEDDVREQRALNKNFDPKNLMAG